MGDHCFYRDDGWIRDGLSWLYHRLFDSGLRDLARLFGHLGETDRIAALQIIGMRFAATAAGERTSISSSTCHRSVCRIFGAAFVSGVLLKTNPS